MEVPTETKESIYPRLYIDRIEEVKKYTFLEGTEEAVATRTPENI